MNKNIGFIILAAILSLTGVFSINLYFKQRSSHDRVNMAEFPREIGAWKAKDIEVDERDYEILETRNLIMREYENPSGDKIALFIIYSDTNRAVFHPPEVCLMGSGVNILDKKREEVRNYDGKAIRVNKIYTEKNRQDSISLYCYKIGNFYTDNFYLQQVYFTFNQLFRSSAGGATINITTSLEGDEAIKLAMLKEFLVECVKIIDTMKK